MLFGIPGNVLVLVISQQVVYLRLQEEGNLDEVLSQLGQESRRPLLLEPFQILQVITELIRRLVASLALSIHLLPDAVYPCDLISEEVLVSELAHDIADLNITIGYESACSILNIVSSFSKVVIELVDEFGAFLQS